MPTDTFSYNRGTFFYNGMFFYNGKGVDISKCTNTAQVAGCINAADVGCYASVDETGCIRLSAWSSLLGFRIRLESATKFIELPKTELPEDYLMFSETGDGIAKLFPPVLELDGVALASLAQRLPGHCKRCGLTACSHPRTSRNPHR